MPVVEPVNVKEWNNLTFSEFFGDTLDEVWDYIYDTEKPIFIEFLSKNLAINYRQKLYIERNKIHRDIFSNLTIYAPISILLDDSFLYLLWSIPQKNIATHKKLMLANFTKEKAKENANV